MSLRLNCWIACIFILEFTSMESKGLKLMSKIWNKVKILKLIKFLSTKLETLSYKIFPQHLYKNYVYI